MYSRKKSILLDSVMTFYSMATIWIEKPCKVYDVRNVVFKHHTPDVYILKDSNSMQQS